MKVFILILSSSYEGKSEPFGVFSSLEKALEQLPALIKGYGFWDYEIYEYNLDEMVEDFESFPYRLKKIDVESVLNSLKPFE
jgi:hypothetical protein